MIQALLRMFGTTHKHQPPRDHTQTGPTKPPAQCPFHFRSTPTEAQATVNTMPRQNHNWWPNQLDLSPLQTTNGNPMATDFNYHQAFMAIDYYRLKQDLAARMRESASWWPADFGHYGPLFIRLAWHSAGTYRTADGRGGSRSGQQRFAPLNSWPDNTNLDKARRLLWPIKQKYGMGISWADLMLLAGHVALEDMGFKTIGFSGGRSDVWQPEKHIDWGSEARWLESQRQDQEGQLQWPLAAVQMGLIYVNPEGPNGEPDPLQAANDIRRTFERMGMNDEETVALIAGGHTFGKAHGASGAQHLASEPEAAPIEEQGLGWKNSYGTGHGPDTITSGLEVTWTSTPVQWSHGFFKNLFENEWHLVKSPGGAFQWQAQTPKQHVPDAFDPNTSHPPAMLTTDLALRYDPTYNRIARQYYEQPPLFEKAFAQAWYKLTHRDMGPRILHIGPETPSESFIWQDPLPTSHTPIVDTQDIEELKQNLRKSGLTPRDLMHTAWASASTFRASDMRGGGNGARIQLEPQNSWTVNRPNRLSRVLQTLREIQNQFNTSSTKSAISLADLIVLGGAVGLEMSLSPAFAHKKVRFTPGRVDATQAHTDAASFAVLEPQCDGFRNFATPGIAILPEKMLIDRAQQLTLSVAQMTVLIGGMRVLDLNTDDNLHGVFTHHKGTLSNDFFVHLLDMQTEWKPLESQHDLFEGRDRTTHQHRWTATRLDLLFGSHSELRAMSEVYASSDMHEKFVDDFIAAWVKVMELDRFDLHQRERCFPSPSPI